MRKKIFSGVFSLALLATAGWGVNKSMSNDASLNDLALSNVEALADGESGDKGCKLHLTSICETQHSDHYLYRNR